MSLNELLSRRFGDHITITVSPAVFTFATFFHTVREPPLLRVSGGRLTAVGAAVHDPAATGTLVSIFEDPPPSAWSLEHEDFCVMFCRYHLQLLETRGGFWHLIGVRPCIDVLGAASLRSFFRGREIRILDRVLRQAGAGAIRFVDEDEASPVSTTAPAA